MRWLQAVDPRPPDGWRGIEARGLEPDPPRLRVIAGASWRGAVRRPG